MRPRRTPLLALAAAVVCATPSPGAAAGKPWYEPDQSKVQLGGWIGFVSPGVGWAWLDRRLEADLFFGWVPPPLGGEHIVSFTGKVTWLPWRVGLGRTATAHPLTLSGQLTYTLGSEYFVFEPDKYPTSNYLPLPTALRAGLGIGGDAGRPLWGLDRVSLYWEAVLNDVMLGYWIGNTDALTPLDALSLAFGLRFEF